MRRAFDLLKLLADGTEHAGEDLAAELGVTRAAVWNHVSRLRAEGVDIDADGSHGYVLRGGYDALEAAQISAQLAALGCARYNRIETIEVTDSTNERLLQEQAAGDVHGRVLFAEYQNAGRGRRGDRWMSPPGSGLCFSLAWRFDAPPTTFSALSLVVGVALVESLQPLGIRDALLKWPNDIVRGAGKMAGILIEMRSELSGPSTTVIGVGLNVSLSTHARELIDRPSDDFLSAGGSPLSRNVLAASLLAGLATALDTFAREGFAPFRDRWHALDALAARKVTLELGPRTVVGVARGVDEHGALIIEHDGQRERFMSGHLLLE
jgi:BirA family transcriptional regulator, biotin operon repressor / biotin---[acetyl-CoA-carboxylase] ligase